MSSISIVIIIMINIHIIRNHMIRMAVIHIISFIINNIIAIISINSIILLR